MSLIPAIPDFMLGMSATLHRRQIQSSLYDDVVHTEDIELTNIGIDKISRLERAASDQYLGSSGETLLYYDMSRSLPKGVEFSKLDEITYNGNRYIVLEVDPGRMERGEVHHWEILMQIVETE